MAASLNRSTTPVSRPWIRAVALVIGLALAAAACAGDGSNTIRLSQDEPDLTPSSGESSVAPTTVVDIGFMALDGSARTTGEFHGHPLVVNFFAAWCAACVAEMPHLETVFAEFDGEVAFLGLSQDASVSDAEELIADTGVTYDIGWDPDLEAFFEFGGYAMPTTVFIDDAGNVVEIFSGALNADALRERLDAIRT
jgi:thiol-disulfide isomerase/thioredoxin